MPSPLAGHRAGSPRFRPPEPSVCLPEMEDKVPFPDLWNGGSHSGGRILHLSRRLDVGELGPRLAGHEVGPAPVEPPGGLLTEDVVGAPGEVAEVGAGVPEAHPGVERVAARDAAAKDLLDLVPVLAVVLLEEARRAEGPQDVDAERLLDLRRRRCRNRSPRPDLDLAGPAWLPHAHGAVREIREVREHG